MVLKGVGTNSFNKKPIMATRKTETPIESLALKGREKDVSNEGEEDGEVRGGKGNNNTSDAEAEAHDENVVEGEVEEVPTRKACVRVWVISCVRR
ncbi:hypothetical protein S83_002801 [Arachis hypogaea]